MVWCVPCGEQVLLVNFGDDWIGVSFWFVDDDNYCRFEVPSFASPSPTCASRATTEPA